MRRAAARVIALTGVILFFGCKDNGVVEPGSIAARRSTTPPAPGSTKMSAGCRAVKGDYSMTFVPSSATYGSTAGTLKGALNITEISTFTSLGRSESGIGYDVTAADVLVFGPGDLMYGISTQTWIPVSGAPEGTFTVEGEQTLHGASGAHFGATGTLHVSGTVYPPTEVTFAGYFIMRYEGTLCT